jgi:hypothetical protein
MALALTDPLGTSSRWISTQSRSDFDSAAASSGFLTESRETQKQERGLLMMFVRATASNKPALLRAILILSFLSGRAYLLPPSNLMANALQIDLMPSHSTPIPPRVPETVFNHSSVLRACRL